METINDKIIRGNDKYSSRKNATKKAKDLKVGDKTKMYGEITEINTHVTGDAIEIYGTKDRNTVWKNTLIELA